MCLKRIVVVGLAVALSPAMAFAYPQDAKPTTQFFVNPASAFVGPPAPTGLPTSAATNIDQPSQDNGANGPNGIFFCTIAGNGCLPLSKAVCDGSDKRIIQWTLTTTQPSPVPLQSAIKVYASASGCTFTAGQFPKDKNNNPMTIDTVNSITTGNQLINGNQGWKFPGTDFAGSNSHYSTVADFANTILACDDTGINNTRYSLCVAVDLAKNGAPDGIIDSSDVYAYATVLVDTVPPDPPSTFIVTSSGSTLKLTIGQATNSSEIYRYTIRYHPAPNGNAEADANDDCTQWTNATEDTQIRVGSTDAPANFAVTGVPSGIIDVCAAGQDLAGNIGGFSTVKRVVTHDECDFIECYPGEPPTGYCGSVPPTMLALWMAIPLLARRRWRKKALVVAPFVLATIVPSTAKAILEPPSEVWVSDSEGENTAKRPHFGVELRMGPMKPTIGDADAQRVYDKVFDSKSLFKHKPMMVQLEVDWYLFKRYGLGGLFGRIGHWRTSGHTRNCASSDDPTATCTPDTIDASTPGASKTSLSIIPLTVGIIYKFDVIKEKTWIPLVPYAKAGADWYLWSSTVNGKASRAADGSKGHGGQFGVNGSIGIALNLDWIDADAARNAQNGAGIADTYLFFEWTGVYGKIRSKSLDFSSSYFLAGLSLDFL